VTDLYTDPATAALSLADLKALFVAAGARRLYIKRLAPNDTSKQQIYVGGSPEETRPIPTGAWKSVKGTSKKGEANADRYILSAPVFFHWLRPDGVAVATKETSIIMYPQYGAQGEYRLSGFLSGAPDRPSTLLNESKRGREPGRILFFGVPEDRSRVLAFLVPGTSRIAREIEDDEPIDKSGVLEELDLSGSKHLVASEEELLLTLGDIHRRSWLNSTILKAAGPAPCSGPQCIGQTLLAAMGVPADGRAAPDYRGWEVKAYTVKKHASRASAKVTLMTPEPTGGYYAAHGAEAFLRKYGSPSKDPAKIYFEGAHKFGVRHHKRGTVISLEGYDPVSRRIVDASGGIRLRDTAGAIAAEWGFGGLVEHWRNKHARAVFVPAVARAGPPRQFWYSDKVHLGVGNPFEMFMDSMVAGQIFYDPGIRYDTTPGVKIPLKNRNQFRLMVPRELASLYAIAKLYTPVR